MLESPQSAGVAQHPAGFGGAEYVGAGGFTRQAMIGVRTEGDPMKVGDRLAQVPEVGYVSLPESEITETREAWTARRTGASEG